MGELRLTVSPQVFVTETFGDLVIAVKTGHHQQLFEQLRRLRQRKEMTIVDTAGHQVVASAFRRAFGQHGGFNVDKAVVIQETTHRHRHFVAQHQVFLHVGSAQIQNAVRQAGGLRQVVVIQLERRRDRRVEHGQLVAQHFNLAALQVVVRGAFRASTHQPLDLNTKLVANIFSHLEHLRAIRITNNLDRALAIAQIDEDHATVITATVDPATQTDGCTLYLLSNQAAVMSSHRHGDFSFCLM